MTSGSARRWASLIGGAVGLVLFVVMLRDVGVDAALAAMQRVGAGFLVIMLLAGVRLAARAGAWTICAGGSDRLPLLTAMNACIVGEAAGNVMPLGLIASEPAKIWWAHARLGTVDAAASLGAESLLYSVGVALMLLAGTLAWAAAVEPSWTGRGLAAFVSLIILAASGGWFLARHRRRLPRVDAGWRTVQRLVGSHRSTVGEALRRTALTLRRLAAADRGSLLQVCLLQVVFQAAAVTEIWVTLDLLGNTRATLRQAFLLEYANRAVTVLFKFVPMRIGVDELAGGGMARAVGMAGATGITVALVRKARVLCWTAVGVALAGRRLLRAHPRAVSVRAVETGREDVSS